MHLRSAEGHQGSNAGHPGSNRKTKAMAHSNFISKDRQSAVLSNYFYSGIGAVTDWQSRHDGLRDVSPPEGGLPLQHCRALRRASPARATPLASTSQQTRRQQHRYTILRKATHMSRGIMKICCTMFCITETRTRVSKKPRTRVDSTCAPLGKNRQCK